MLVTDDEKKSNIMGNIFLMFYFLYSLWFITIILLLNDVDGFICPIYYNIHRHTIMSSQINSALFDDNNPIYPTDTLVNIGSIGLNSTQVLQPDIAYFYLQNTLGLSEETMWKITLEAGSGAYIMLYI